MSVQRGVQRTNNQYRGSMEWYTPRWLVARIAAFLDDGWYDPCPASHGKVCENGLVASWKGKRVFCNPPYGRDIVPWVRKAMTEPAHEIILLVPAYTDTQWFSPLYSHSICFVHGRLYFHRPNGQQDTRTPHPSVLVYRGRRYRQFADAFSDLGPIMRTYRAKRDAQPRLLEVPA